MTISTAGVVFEGRNVDILPEWRDAVGHHLARLASIYAAPALTARVCCIRKRSGHRWGFELQLVIRLGNRTVAVMQQGEDVPALLDQAFDSAQREMDMFMRARISPRSGSIHFGRVRWLDAHASFGFIDGGEAGDVHFRRDVVHGGRVTVGTSVSFALQPDESAPTAAWVSVFGG